MRTKNSHGASSIEFAFILLVMIPLFLGTVGVGLNMLTSLQTIQLARDAGHMYARGADVDFSLPGNKGILAAIGSGIGMSATYGAGNAVVILSTVIYMDDSLCTLASMTIPLCTNHNRWVFTQRLVIGNQNVHTSNFGSPVISCPTPPAGCVPVILDGSGKVTLNAQQTNPNDRATFTGINPFANTAGVITGLPSGQVIYVSEAAAQGLTMPPFTNGTGLYSYTMF